PSALDSLKLLGTYEMGDIWLAARTNNTGRINALLDKGVNPSVTRWVSRTSSIHAC
ncbi:unnamed protein product, partial [Choristocarpus tenellus]